MKTLTRGEFIGAWEADWRAFKASGLYGGHCCDWPEEACPICEEPEGSVFIHYLSLEKFERQYGKIEALQIRDGLNPNMIWTETHVVFEVGPLGSSQLSTVPRHPLRDGP